MRNVPFAFLDENTIDRINAAAEERRRERVPVDAFAKLAETQRSMRGMMKWPDAAPSSTVISVVKRTAKRFVAMLEKMMEMSGPNSIANLERSIRAQSEARN